MNRMTNILDNGSSLLAHYTWDSLSRQTSISYGDGTTDAYSQYDAADNLQTLTQTFSGGSNVTFSYGWQKNHQRSSTGVSDGGFQYVPSVGTTNYGAANADNGYPSAGGASLSYDGNQNLAFDGTNTLTYDVENRLVQAQNLAWGTSQYLYDPLGNRKQKQVSASVTQFVVAGGEEIADLSSAGWTLTVRGVGGLPVAAITPASGGSAEYVVYYHHDVAGSTTIATSSGSSPEVYTYGEFGVAGAGSYLHYTYAGYRYDSETGLYYVHARYYNPTLGRFLQTDPIGTQGGNNLYAYVNNDPINAFDPLGLCSDSPERYLTTSSDGSDFIKSYEQLRLDVYDANPPNGDMTIGWGHKLEPGENLTSITVPQANDLFSADLSKMEEAVNGDLNSTARQNVTQNEFDAFVSLRFNAGQNAITPPVADFDRTGQATMADFTQHYITSGGVFMQGLLNRRTAEWGIYNSGVYNGKH